MVQAGPWAFVVPAAGEKLHGGYALTRISERGNETWLKIAKKH